MEYENESDSDLSDDYFNTDETYSDVDVSLEELPHGGIDLPALFPSQSLTSQVVKVPTGQGTKGASSGQGGKGKRKSTGDGPNANGGDGDKALVPAGKIYFT